MRAGDWTIAVVGENVPWDPVAHARWDLPASSVTITETEERGQATFKLVLATTDAPAVFGPGALRWAHLGRVLADGVTVRHMAYGHLVTLPSRAEGNGGYPTLTYVCGPLDYDTPARLAAAAYATLPQFDPALVPKSERVEPREILDGWFRTVHCDRRTHGFTCPDRWGLGLPAFAGYAMGDVRPQVRLGEPPISEVDITLVAEYVQCVDVIVDKSNELKGAFPYGFVDTYTPDQLVKDWFKPGQAVSGSSGWTWVDATLTRMNQDGFASKLPLAAPGQSIPLYGPPMKSAPEKARYVNYYSYALDQRVSQQVVRNSQDGTKKRAFVYNDPTTAGDPGNLLSSTHYYDRCYFDAFLTALGSLRQKRVETMRATIVSAAQQTAPGPRRTLSLRCEDITDTSSTLPWQPLTQYQVGDQRRVGLTTVQCLVAHVSAGYWGADLTVRNANGTTSTLWEALPYDASPLADRSAPSYFALARGEQTMQAAVCKAVRMIDASLRNANLRFRLPLVDDYLDLDTACQFTVTAPTWAIDCGTVTAKVTEVDISSDGSDEYVDVTLEAGTGSGADFTPFAGLPANPPGFVNTHGPAWATVAYYDYHAQQPIPTPTFAGQVKVTNGADDQAAYVTANDYVAGDPVRGKDVDSDPDALLRKVPTAIEVVFSQLANLPTLEHDVTLVIAGPYNGPRQYDTGA